MPFIQLDHFIDRKCKRKSEKYMNDLNFKGFESLWWFDEMENEEMAYMQKVADEEEELEKNLKLLRTS